MWTVVFCFSCWYLVMWLFAVGSLLCGDTLAVAWSPAGGSMSPTWGSSRVKMRYQHEQVTFAIPTWAITDNKREMGSKRKECRNYQRLVDQEVECFNIFHLPIMGACEASRKHALKKCITTNTYFQSFSLHHTSIKNLTNATIDYLRCKIALCSLIDRMENKHRNEVKR